MTIKALAFDIFGTIVDWRSSIAREVDRFLAEIGREDVDSFVFARAWRDFYQPRMADCRSGARPYTPLEELIAEALDETLAANGIAPEGLGLGRRIHFVHAWRRLDPWPDVVEGLCLLQARFPLVALSNGNLALTMHLARHGGYRWDAILGAEVAQTYKPLPRPYDQAVDMLSIRPEELCLVAAHEDDLRAARMRGLSTAYLHRPLEFGPDEIHLPEGDWSYSADNLRSLSEELSGQG
ncbi:2-haloacid dehalogenase [Sphingomonas palmae]|uniref:(S)-2-haloacid dehalogenase n=1 Tax=Sphingomonas palmae TaxID=1855283 RepID=A0A1H7T4J8_9SPHN|nr:haloacid dehalogenase type II [Sphingomonas palmae]SEL79429.1 2-haloacid dehalogenase [Sphingomonas palmae]